MSVHTLIGPSVVDALLALEAGVETLRELRSDPIADAWDRAREQRSRAYFDKLDREGAR